MPELDEILKRLSESESQEVCHEALRQIYESSLYLTSKHLFHYSDMTKYTHGGICEVLQSASLRKLLCVPRGCFKSSIGVISYPIWRLMKNPNLRILIDSEVYSNSKNFLREIKAHLASPRFMQLYGDWKSDTNWNEGEITIRTRTKPYKEASITCGGIGTVKVGQHYDLIIGDDLNSGNNSGTPEARRKVVQHYQMNTAILEPGGTYVIIGTRYAADDLIGWILSNEVDTIPLVS
jgi:hypothetical protein